MTGNDSVELTGEGEVRLLELCNAPRNNAVSTAMWTQMGRLVERLARDDALRVLIVRGRGHKAFSAGADISEFSERRSEPAAIRAYDEFVERTCQQIEALPAPTIAMIHGYCIGAGLSLAAACDLRLCDRRASFALPAARLGLGYDVHGIERIVNLIGVPFSKEILYTARRIDAERALQIGLVHHVTETEQLEGAVRELAEDIRRNAPLTVRAMKVCAHEILKSEGRRDLARCLELVDRCNQSEDYREGRAAFVEKREPDFRGR